MITGTVTDREPVIQLTVRDPGGEREIEAVVDTGFDRFLTLPADAISALGLKQFRQGRALLADGSEIAFDVYEATVSWDGATRRFPLTKQIRRRWSAWVCSEATSLTCRSARADAWPHRRVAGAIARGNAASPAPKDCQHKRDQKQRPPQKPRPAPDRRDGPADDKRPRQDAAP